MRPDTYDVRVRRDFQKSDLALRGYDLDMDWRDMLDFLERRR